MSFNNKSENRIAAYLDILGVSSFDENQYDKLLEALTWISNQNHNGYVSKKPLLNNSAELIETKLSFSSFSDSILITSSKINEEEDDNLYMTRSLDLILDSASNIILKCLELGFLLRGAISYGKIYHTMDIVIGKPLIESVKAEESLAKNPRVIFCQKLIDKIPLIKLHNKSNIIRDQDGIFYLNWIDRAFRSRELSIRKKLIENLISVVKNNLDLHKNIQSNFAKWCWIANYLNEEIPIYLEFEKSNSIKSYFNFEKIQIPTITNGKSFSEIKIKHPTQSPA